MKINGTSSNYSISFGAPTNWLELDFNRTAIGITKFSGVANVKGGFRWNHDDEDKTKWFPQGLTAIETTKNNKTYQFMVVSWYFPDKTKGVRLSFVDTVAPRHYRHVLLVMPDSKGSLAPLTGQHAGGIEIIGTKLYVTDTSFGIREFDLGNIYDASNVSSFDAFNYKYIMPQVRSYDASVEIKDNTLPRFSYLSRIWKAGALQLLSGNFNIDGDKKFGNSPSRVCRWDVDQTSGSITLVDNIIQLNCQRVQGAALCLRDGTDDPESTKVLYLSRSYGIKQYKLYVVEVPLDYNPIHRLDGFTKYDWFSYSEDLHLSETDNLWCQTEKSRKVFYVNLGDYPS